MGNGFSRFTFYVLRFTLPISSFQTMRDKFYHEGLYRGEGALQALRHTRITVCGAGAVGSNLVNNLVRQGLQDLTVIDCDRIEAHNISTQTYTESDVGMLKVDALQAEIFRAVNVEIRAVRQKLTERNVAKLLKNAELVVDGFDNHAARGLVTEHCRTAGMPCLHVGLSADYAEMIWNDRYRVPQDTVAADVCEYPMARNLIQFAVALASEAIVRFVLTNQQHSYAFTLQDLQITIPED
jgi:tRNA A37 threonylcarbamoyladenosine dehydratase